MDPEDLTPEQQMFPPTIGDPNVDNSPPAEQGAQPSAIEQQIAEMRAQMERQNAEFAQREQFYQQQLDSFMQQRSAPAQSAPVTPQLPSLDDLPDPLQNPQAYNKALAERIAAREQALVQSVQQNVSQSVLSEVTRATALDQLWNRFNAHPEYGALAKKQLLLQGAAAATFQELRARGVDPVNVAAQNPDSLMAAIAQRMQQEIGGPLPTTPGTGAARTVGLSGGSAAVPGTTPQTPKTPSFHEQHLKAQQLLGLI